MGFSFYLVIGLLAHFLLYSLSLLPFVAFHLTYWNTLQRNFYFPLHKKQETSGSILPQNYSRIPWAKQNERITEVAAWAALERQQNYTVLTKTLVCAACFSCLLHKLHFSHESFCFEELVMTVPCKKGQFHAEGMRLLWVGYNHNFQFCEAGDKVVLIKSSNRFLPPYKHIMFCSLHLEMLQLWSGRPC